MQILKTINELKNFRKNCAGSVGLVPTMGALHAGHQSLIKRAVAENDKTIVSIFVNPTQFGANEDFDKYPRKFEDDLQMCQSIGAAAVFAPNASEMYSENEVQILAPQNLAYVLEGFDRPGHFDGVLQVVLKLFSASGANRAYFGKKDAQQLLIIQKMVERLFLSVEICACEIVRDFDSLALSSRNVYLSADERATALKIPQTIEMIKNAVGSGENDVSELENLARQNLDSEKLHIFYAKFRDYDLRKISHIQKGNCIFLLAVGVGQTRLIDNIWF